MNTKDTAKTIRTAMRNTRKAYKTATGTDRAALAERFDNLRSDLRHVTHCEDSRYCGWHA